MGHRIGESAGFARAKTALSRPLEQRISISYAMPARCQIWIRISDSGNPAGAQVSLLAALVLSAVRVRVVYRASPVVSRTPPDEIAITLPLVPEDERLARPSRTFRGPPGGSRTSLQLFDHERAPLTEEHEVGTLVDGIHETTLPVVARVHPAAWLTTRGRPLAAEPMLRLDGELVFVSGIGMRLRMRPVAGAQERGDLIDLPLTNVGTTVHFADRLVERNLPGLPAIHLTFLGSDGRPIGREQLAHVPEE